MALDAVRTEPCSRGLPDAAPPLEPQPTRASALVPQPAAVGPATADPGARALAFAAAAGFLPLVALFRAYPRLAAAVVAPVASFAVAAYFASDFVALLLGAYCLGLGLLFANWAAEEIVRDARPRPGRRNVEDHR